MDDKTKFVLGVVLSVGIVLRGYFLLNYELIDARQYPIFLSDEAIVGLMGKHIVTGMEFPVFFYGQQYLGAFEAYLVALSFAALGISLMALKLVPALFSIILLFLVYLLGAKLFNRRVGVLSTALVAVPSPYFFAWGFKARGGFIEYVVLSLIVLLLFSLIYFHRKDSFWLYGLFGFFAGFSLWVNQLILPFLALLGLYIWFKPPVLLSRARLLVLIVTLLVGAAPLIISNVINPLATFRTLARKEFDVRGDTSHLDYQDGIERIVGGLSERLIEFPQVGQTLAAVFGFQGSAIEEPGLLSTPSFQNLPELPYLYGTIILVFFGSAFVPWLYGKIRPGLTALARWNSVIDRDNRSKLDLLVLLSVVSLVGYFRSRYLLICYPLVAIMAAVFVDDLRGKYLKRIYTGLFIATVGVNGYGILDIALEQSRSAIPKLVKTLETNSCSYGFSARPMYYLGFYSLEKAIFVPLEPHRSRYDPYETEIMNAADICYVFSADDEEKKEHQAFMKMLHEQDIRYQIVKVDKYSILTSVNPRERITQTLLEEVRL